jgi:RNA polymerase sigma-70 factor (ECF subfamily)
VRAQSRSDDPAAVGHSRRLEEAELLDKARRGNRDAIAELYHRHANAIYRYVYARVQDAVLAEDLTAQVFLKALEGLPSYEPSGTPFLGWLYRIAHARTVDHWRRQQRRREVPLTEDLPSAEPGADEISEAEAEWIAAIGLLAQLTDDQQEVILLRFIGEMSLAETATILAKTVGAVKAIQHRALASLARLLEQQETVDPYERGL